MRSQRPSINITDQAESIIADLCARVPEFDHIDPCRVLACLARARRGTRGGVYAKIVPMRFADGSPWKRVDGQCYAIPQIPTVQGDILYLIYLYIPRFFELPAERRLLTLVHELYHIAPAFDGTIRRVGGRAHGASREQFNARLQPVVRQYLEGQPPVTAHELLQGDLRAMAKHATLTGRVLALPKPVRIPPEGALTRT